MRCTSTASFPSTRRSASNRIWTPCVDCRKALERQREVQVALDNIAIEPSPALLRSCREELHMRLAEESQSGAKHGFWERFTDMLTGRSASAGWLKPAGALTLIALGFGVARLVPPGAFGSGGPFEMGMVEPASRVRYVEPASDGKVQIVLDETRQRIVSGGLNDQKIRVLLLSAAKDPVGPGVARRNGGDFEWQRAIVRCAGCAGVRAARTIRTRACV